MDSHLRQLERRVKLTADPQDIQELARWRERSGGCRCDEPFPAIIKNIPQYDKYCSCPGGTLGFVVGCQCCYYQESIYCYNSKLVNGEGVTCFAYRKGDKFSVILQRPYQPGAWSTARSSEHFPHQFCCDKFQAAVENKE